VHLAYISIVCHFSAKNYQNRWKFDAVLTKTNLLSFLRHGVLQYFYNSIATIATKDPRHISYRNRVIAHFVPNFVGMATGSVRVKFGWQRSTAHPQTSIDATTLQISCTEAEL